MTRKVSFDEAQNLWVYEDTGEPATLADTVASLRDFGPATAS